MTSITEIGEIICDLNYVLYKRLLFNCGLLPTNNRMHIGYNVMIVDWFWNFGPVYYQSSDVCCAGCFCVYYNLLIRCVFSCRDLRLVPVRLTVWLGLRTWSCWLPQVWMCWPLSGTTTTTTTTRCRSNTTNVPHIMVWWMLETWDSRSVFDVECLRNDTR